LQRDAVVGQGLRDRRNLAEDMRRTLAVLPIDDTARTNAADPDRADLQQHSADRPALIPVLTRSVTACLRLSNSATTCATAARLTIT